MAASTDASDSPGTFLDIKVGEPHLQGEGRAQFTSYKLECTVSIDRKSFALNEATLLIRRTELTANRRVHDTAVHCQWQPAHRIHRSLPIAR